MTALRDILLTATAALLVAALLETRGDPDRRLVLAAFLTLAAAVLLGAVL